MKSIYFSAEHEAFRVQLRQFLQDLLRGNADSWEEARRVPKEAWLAFGQEGLLGLLHSPAWGGRGLDIYYSVVFLEELGRTGYAGLRAAVSLHAYMATHYLAHYGDDALREAYLRPSLRGEMVSALAITEQNAGSDLSRLACSAQLDGDEFVVDGEKVFITNASIADYYILAVRTGASGNSGISLLLVDANLPGITVSTQEKIGWHSAATAVLRFEAVRVPRRNLVGRLNAGFMYLMRGFQLERLAAASLALGGADACLQDTIAHVAQRQAFEGSLAQLQSVRHRIANMAAALLSTRTLAYHAAWVYQQDALAAKECSMAKLQATELACRVAEECLQLQGARGYLADSAIARAYRDSRAGLLAGGATEVMRDIIAQQIIDTSCGQRQARSRTRPVAAPAHDIQINGGALLQQ